MSESIKKVVLGSLALFCTCMYCAKRKKKERKGADFENIGLLCPLLTRESCRHCEEEPKTPELYGRFRWVFLRVHLDICVSFRFKG